MGTSAQSFQTSVMNLIQGTQFDDPNLKEALIQMATDLYTTYNTLFPPATKSFGTTGPTVVTPDALGFQSVLFSNNVRLSWDDAGAFVQYEVRYHFGTSTDWDTATHIITTSTLSADINPVAIPLIYGNHTFLLKVISNGNYSTTAHPLTINIPLIAAPVISPTVIDNNVLLNWTIPTVNFQLDHYNIYKNNVLVGNMNGTFEAFFETVSDTYTYGVEAVDIVGNVGTRGSVTVIVNQPPDYELSSDLISDFSGTKVNCALDGINLLCCINSTESWDDHFANNSFTDIADQIAAGYPYYLEPGQTTGSYEEVIDYGTLITNVILSLRWSIFDVNGSVTVASKISFSSDGITYGTVINGQSAFSASMQYAKIHIDFAGDVHSLMKFSNLEILLDVKREMDSGNVIAVKTDSGGTAVLFNKVFKSIDSIVLTVAAVEPITAIYAFTDIPNPTGFSVYALDSTGNRTTYLVSWHARGVV